MIYGNRKVEYLFQRMKQTEDDSDNLNERLSFFRIDPMECFTTGQYTVTALPAKHDDREDCFLYDIVSAADGKRLLYGNDTALFPKKTFQWMMGKRYDCVSLDCTMGGEKGCASHMSLTECMTVKDWMLEHGCADEETKFILTHFSHNGGLLHEELTARAVPHKFLVAYDGMVAEV